MLVLDLVDCSVSSVGNELIDELTPSLVKRVIALEEGSSLQVDILNWNFVKMLEILDIVELNEVDIVFEARLEHFEKFLPLALLTESLILHFD